MDAMGLMEELTGPGGIATWIKNNPQAVAAACSMLSQRAGTVGGTGGLGGLVASFEKGGLGDVMASWVGTGANKPVTPGQLSDVLGSDVLKQFGQAAGLSHTEAGSALSALLPVLVNGLTPKGQVPQSSSLESTLGGLLKSLGQ
jgi:uncharacterized protein YidB (DUF937 family)